MISVECDFCGDEVEMYKSQWKQRERTYCDDNCRSKGMSERYSNGDAPQAGAHVIGSDLGVGTHFDYDQLNSAIEYAVEVARN